MFCKFYGFNGSDNGLMVSSGSDNGILMYSSYHVDLKQLIFFLAHYRVPDQWGTYLHQCNTDSVSFFKHKPTRSSRFLCGPRDSLNSSLIEWLFTRQCEMPALRRGVSGKKQATPSFVWLFGWMHSLHCSRLTVQPHQTLSFTALSWAARPLPSARSEQGRDFERFISLRLC